MISTRLSMQGTIEIEVDIRCEGCQLEHKNSIEAPISFRYNLSSKRFEPNLAEMKRLEDSAVPEGWTVKTRGQMFSGEAHYTEWPEYRCQHCSVGQDDA